jgi:hypothetical protein
MVDLESGSTEKEDSGRAGPAAARDSSNEEVRKLTVVRVLSLLEQSRMYPVIRRARAGVFALLAAGLSLVIGELPGYGVQKETQEEKAVNLKQQATGGLFQKWTFDQDQLDTVPRGFVKGVTTNEPLAEWVIQGHATAPSPPHVVTGSSTCAQSCYQLLLAEGMQYEYPDLSVRFHTPEGVAGSGGGVVLGVRDARNFYAALVDPLSRHVRFVRFADGLTTVLGQAPVHLKPVEWHSLRVQRNTIISKDFIEVFVDGTLVLSIEDQALGLGQVGVVIAGTSTMWFDSFHAVPLFSHRPLSEPPAY